MMIIRLDSTNHVDECYMASLVDFSKITTAQPDLIFVDWTAFAFSSIADFFQSPKSFVYNKKQKQMLKDSSK